MGNQVAFLCGCHTEDIYQAFEPKQPTVLRVLEDAVSVPAWWLQGAMSTSQKHKELEPDVMMSEIRPKYIMNNI